MERLRQCGMRCMRNCGTNPCRRSATDGRTRPAGRRPQVSFRKNLFYNRQIDELRRQAPPSPPFSFMAIKHFLQFSDFTLDELEHVIERTRVIKRKFKNYEPYHPLE